MPTHPRLRLLPSYRHPRIGRPFRYQHTIGETHHLFAVYTRGKLGLIPVCGRGIVVQCLFSSEGDGEEVEAGDVKHLNLVFGADTGKPQR